MGLSAPLVDRDLTSNDVGPTIDLPAWPILVLYWLFPVFWLLGIGVLAPVVLAPVLLAYLLLLPDVRFPRALLPWLAFLVVVVGSVVGIDTFARGFGFLYRLSNYVAATLALLYVYNASHRTLSDRQIVMALAAFWGWIVLGGLLGVLFEDQSIRTPLSLVMPGFLLSNDLVQAWVIPNLSEVQQPWGSPVAFARPSAPFAYTNAWGCNFALLVPFALSALTMLQGWRRLALGALILLSMIPVASTLNRGMFLALSVGLGYVLLRFALEGRIATMLGLATASGGVVLVLVAAGVVDRIILRTTYSTTNIGRLALYRETFERTLESPLLGWGGPRPSRLIEVSVGTQGHIWNVMFSHGFLALGLFVGSMVLFAWSTRHAVGLRFAAHVTLVMSATAILYYGFDGPQMVTALVSAGLALRPSSPAPQDAASEVSEEPRPAP